MLVATGQPALGRLSTLVLKTGISSDHWTTVEITPCSSFLSISNGKVLNVPLLYFQIKKFLSSLLVKQDGGLGKVSHNAMR